MATRRKTPDKLALRIARAQLRELRNVKITRILDADMRPLIPEPKAETYFVQCWSVQRGGFSAVTQALDSSGQVWERVSLMAEEIINDKKVKVLKESWWEPLSMSRRERKEEA